MQLTNPLPHTYPSDRSITSALRVLAMMTTNDFDEEAPTIRIPRETMLEARERSAPARMWSNSTTIAPPDRADTVDDQISDGVPTPIEDDATTEPHVLGAA